MNNSATDSSDYKIIYKDYKLIYFYYFPNIVRGLAVNISLECKCSICFIFFCFKSFLRVLIELVEMNSSNLKGSIKLKL